MKIQFSRYSYLCSLPLLLISFHHLALAQYFVEAKPSENTRSIQVTSPNIALYTFLRAAAADGFSDTADKARSAALISGIGLNAKDRTTVQNIFSEYSTSIRSIHDPAALPASTSELQKAEIVSYVHVIRRLRTELTPVGLQQLRYHLEIKKTKMQFHVRSETNK